MAVIPVVEVDGYVQRNGLGPRKHPSSLFDRVMVPDPDLRPKCGGVDRDVVPISGYEHESWKHQWILLFFGREHPHGEDERQELARETVDRGGALGSDGLLKSGLDFFAFRTEIRHFGFEEVQSLSEVRDGEVRHRF